MGKYLLCAATALAFLASVEAAAAPIDVTVSTTQSATNWLYEFTFTNNVGQGQLLYYFGVNAPGPYVTVPTGFTIRYGDVPGLPQTPGFTAPNKAWLTDPFSDNHTVGLGQSITAVVSDFNPTAQTSFDWFAYTVNPSFTAYTGPGNYGSSTNPLFRGTATAAASAVPEPATWTMMIVGFGAIGFAARRRRRVAVSYA